MESVFCKGEIVKFLDLIERSQLSMMMRHFVTLHLGLVCH